MRKPYPLIVLFLFAGSLRAEGPLGYYRFPSIHGDAIVFTAEGDLWRAPLKGGVAQRLTAHPAEESRGFISPDGKILAFSASYEGPTEVYTLPLEGGVPTRRTWQGASARVAGWTPDGKILFATRRFSTLPNTQLAAVDPSNNRIELLPLSQASDGAYDQAGKQFFFTRFAFQGSFTKRYRGGTAQSIWKYVPGNEAVPLTADFPGTSNSPMWWKGRIYFASDRDGAMNLWSMDEAGKNVKQLTSHKGFDIQSPALGDGKIVYQLGADLRIFDIAANRDSAVPIRLVSDFDQTREHWIKNPVEWVTTAHLSPNGDRLVLTARGEVFVAPAEQGRLVEATRGKKVRYRNARFMPDGKSILALSDQSGELEFWRIPANGTGEPARLTEDGSVFRYDGVPSPDGKWIGHHDKNQQLWLYNVDTRRQKKIAASQVGDFSNLSWSPDSKWLAFGEDAANQFTQIKIYSVDKGTITPVTTDRYDSSSPAWSADGKFLYFLSDRNLETAVPSPWGARQPEPFFDKQTRIYCLSLTPEARSPFLPSDELHQPPEKSEEKAKGAEAAPAVQIVLDGIERRITEVPVPAGNYGSLATDGKRLYFVSRESRYGGKAALKSLAIEGKGAPAETFMDDVGSFELSLDRKKLMLRKAADFLVVDAGAKAPTDLTKSTVNLKSWTFSLDPREEWRQMFVEAWRLERDYFYDRGMHKVDWPAVRDKYLPLVDRVTDRAELSDILAQMVGELSALHIFVRGGDMRRGPEEIEPASLGAVFSRDQSRGGFRIDHIYRSDPDIPGELSPLARPDVKVEEGEIIEAVNGVAASTLPDISRALRNQAGRQVLLRVAPKEAGKPSRDVVVAPVTLMREADLRYDEWEYTRRLEVEKLGAGKLGYVHLRAMGGAGMGEWTREYYPVFNREGLIIDVRHNNGGNIDSWLLEKLLRKAWVYWQPRVGSPQWNMQYAFRGHIVVLCDENTASDGELFTEGIRRLGLGKVIGTRTWGGEIWLSASNFLVDRGIATAAETGVYGPGGEWVIEGHGVDPDIVVDNLPHATFEGRDAQLEAAVKYLQDEIRRKPVPVPAAPPYPDKSLKAPGTRP